LPFASSYRLITTWFSTVFFLQRTFTSLVHAHAGSTQENQHGQNKAPLVLPVIKTVNAQQLYQEGRI
jgi:hypothetical protein